MRNRKQGNYQNECTSCGKPKHGGEYCAKCWLEKCRPQSIHCITGKAEDLAGLVVRKWGKGFVVYGEELPIGGGYVTQMMVEI